MFYERFLPVRLLDLMALTTILVEAALQQVNTLCRLFNLCLDKSTLLSSWKRCHVCPILKKGDPPIPSNSRPVSLLNTMEKVF